MSNEAITWAYRQPITTGAKFVLVALADMADEAHSCFPGQMKLATMTGQSERTVRRQLAELEISGYLVRSRRFTKFGHRTSDRYTLPVNQDVLIPTGQSDHRSALPPVTVTAGQTDHRPEQVIPTGHHDRVSLREPQRTPPPPASGGQMRKRVHCPKHSRHNPKCTDCQRLQDRADRQASWPAWCGSCNEHTRKLPDELQTRCPDCHPMKAVSA